MYTMQDADMPMPKPSVQVAGSMEYLLKQIQNKPKLRLELNFRTSGVIARSEATKQSHTLEIDTKTVFTAKEDQPNNPMAQKPES